MPSTEMPVTSSAELPLVQSLQIQPRRWTSPLVRGHHRTQWAAWLSIAAVIMLVIGVVGVSLNRDRGSTGSQTPPTPDKSVSAPGNLALIASPVATALLTDPSSCKILSTAEFLDAIGTSTVVQGTPDLSKPLPTVTIPAMELDGPAPSLAIQHAVNDTWRSFASCAQATSVTSMAVLMTDFGMGTLFGRSLDLIHAIASYTDPSTGQPAAPLLESLHELGDGRIGSYVDLGPMQAATAQNYVIFALVGDQWKIDVLAIDLGAPGGVS
jgi:hypothetical protein